MGYVFDGEVDPGAAAVKRRDRGLPRFLAVILFAFAAVIGLPIAAVAAVSLISGDLRPFALVALASPIALMCGWLGKLLWSGRAVPIWFVVPVILIVSLAGFFFVLLFVSWIVVTIAPNP